MDPQKPFALPDLPPRWIADDPPIYRRLPDIRAAVAELKGYTEQMSNPMLLLSPAVIKESLASSEIENVHTTLEEVLQESLFPEVEQREANKEVRRYGEAIAWGYGQLGALPLSTRLILGIHERLMGPGVRGYRRTQNSIKNLATGEAVYTPPEAQHIARLMANWETFANSDSDYDPLIKAALAHYQFEAIHPFVDGNGRTGRILMVLQLVQDRLLSVPVLYISAYINRNRAEYYRLLRNVSALGAWEEYVLFMLAGFHEQALDTKQVVLRVQELYTWMREAALESHGKIVRAGVIEELFTSPFITPTRLAERIGVHYMTASRYLSELRDAQYIGDLHVGKYHIFANTHLLRMLGDTA
ncbi:MAG: Fic family protein [Leptospirales bacterium]|nr:Fic family protein [Leptospirales bacterium]